VTQAGVDWYQLIVSVLAGLAAYFGGRAGGKTNTP
jgi:hypothetical protein